MGASPAQAALSVAYWTVGLVTGAAALYGSARLVGVLEELEATRAELAELAIGRERPRISRDLHDLLGHSLSAISLKGDLARRLLHRDIHAARAEIEGLTGVARNALRDVGAVTRDEHTVSLRTETDGAAALLGAAGIDAPHRPGPAGAGTPHRGGAGVGGSGGHHQRAAAQPGHDLLGHRARRDEMVRLEIVNDRAAPSADQGNGLAGLAERARALSGSASGVRLRGGRFRLLVELPEEAA